MGTSTVGTKMLMQCGWINLLAVAFPLVPVQCTMRKELQKICRLSYKDSSRNSHVSKNWTSTSLANPMQGTTFQQFHTTFGKTTRTMLECKFPSKASQLAMG